MMGRLSLVSLVGMFWCLASVSTTSIAQPLDEGRSVDPSADLPLIVAAAYLDEGDTPLSLEKIQALPVDAWTSFEKGFNAGYRANPHWVRLELRGDVSDQAGLVVRFRPVWHDEVMLFDPVVSDVPQVIGDRHPLLPTGYQSLSLAFEVPSLPKTRVVYARLDSPHSLMVTVDAQILLDMLHDDQIYMAFVMGYLAFLVAVLLFAAGVWLTDRERVVAAYSTQLFFSAAYGASMFGIFRLFLDDMAGSELLNQINYALIVLYPNSVLVFYRLLYADYGMCRWARGTLDAFIYLGLASLLWIAFGQTAFGLQWNAVMLVFASAFAATIPWFALVDEPSAPEATVPLWMLRTAGGLLLSGVVWVLARTLFGAENDLALEGFLMHSFWLALAVAVMLQLRSRRRLVYLRSSALAARARAEEALRAREGLQQFMTMLSHEIKTPLSVLSLAIEHGLNDPAVKNKASTSVKDIGRLVDRCLSFDQVTSGAIQPRPETFDVGDLLDNIIVQMDVAARLRVSGLRDQQVVADAWFTEVVLTNLLENAIKYAPVDQPIEVRLGDVDPTGHWVAITVINPIAENTHLDVTRLFDKFYRGEHAKHHSGAGLGLHLSRVLAKIQGGDLVYNPARPDEFNIEFRIPL